MPRATPTTTPAASPLSPTTTVPPSPTAMMPTATASPSPRPMAPEVVVPEVVVLGMVIQGKVKPRAVVSRKTSITTKNQVGVEVWESLSWRCSCSGRDWPGGAERGKGAGGGSLPPLDIRVARVCITCVSRLNPRILSYPFFVENSLPCKYSWVKEVDKGLHGVHY